MWQVLYSCTERYLCCQNKHKHAVICLRTKTQSKMFDNGNMKEGGVCPWLPFLCEQGVSTASGQTQHSASSQPKQKYFLPIAALSAASLIHVSVGQTQHSDRASPSSANHWATSRCWGNLRVSCECGAAWDNTIVLWVMQLWETNSVHTYMDLCEDSSVS